VGLGDTFLRTFVELVKSMKGEQILGPRASIDDLITRSMIPEAVSYSQ
jgi:hypothetical protein